MIVSVPVKLDDGRRTVFPGYRVQHSSVLGPTKGGIRYDQHVSLGECAALSMWMTWKCALLRLPYGGAKGGIRCDPRALSRGELQAVTRRFTAELLPVHRPAGGHPRAGHGHRRADDGLDDGHVLDAGRLCRARRSSPASRSRSAAPSSGTEATGAGVVMVIERACRAARLEPRRAALRRPGLRQGRRRRGLRAGHERGATVIAVSDVSGGLHNARRARHPVAVRDALEHGHALARRVRGRAHDERGAARAALRHPRPRRARGAGDRRERAAREGADDRRGRERPDHARGRRDLRRARRSRCSRTSSRTPAASPSRTSSGSRTSAACSGTATTSARGSRTRWATRSTASGSSPRTRGLTLRQAALVDRHPRGGRRAERPRALSLTVTLVRDGMLSDPRALAADASAQEAAEHLVRPDVRAVLVVDGDGALVGVVTPDSLVERVVAAGPRPAHDAGLPRSRWSRSSSSTPMPPLDDGYRLLEEAEVERAPVLEQGRLVGVLSRVCRAAAAGRGRASARGRRGYS